MAGPRKTPGYDHSHNPIACYWCALADLTTARAERDAERLRADEATTALVAMTRKESEAAGRARDAEARADAAEQLGEARRVAANDAADRMLTLERERDAERVRAERAEAELANVVNRDALVSKLIASNREREAEKARADRLSDARQELGVERDMIQMENEQLRASLKAEKERADRALASLGAANEAIEHRDLLLDTSSTEVARLRGLLREWWPEDREAHSALSTCPMLVTTKVACLMCRTQGALAPVGAPLDGKEPNHG